MQSVYHSFLKIRRLLFLICGCVVPFLTVRCTEALLSLGEEAPPPLPQALPPGRGMWIGLEGTAGWCGRPGTPGALGSCERNLLPCPPCQTDRGPGRHKWAGLVHTEWVTCRAHF